MGKTLVILLLLGAMLSFERAEGLECYVCEGSDNDCVDGPYDEYEKDCDSTTTTQAPTTSTTEKPTTTTTEKPTTTTTEKPTTTTTEEPTTTTTEKPTTTTTEEPTTTTTEKPTTTTTEEPTTTTTEKPTTTTTEATTTTTQESVDPIIQPKPTYEKPLENKVKALVNRYIRSADTKADDWKCFIYFTKNGDKEVAHRGCTKKAQNDLCTSSTERCGLCDGDLCNSAMKLAGFSSLWILLGVALFFTR